MPGPAPRDPALRARQNKAASRAELAAATPLAEKPGIPDPPAAFGKWHPLVIEWWDDLWALPQARLYTAMHKHRAYIALHAMHDYYTNPTERRGQRLEVALQGLGASEADLRKLQWSAPVDKPGDAKPAAAAKNPKTATARDPRKRLRIVG